MSSFKITYFDNLYNPQGQLYDLSLEELIKVVSKNYEVPYKDNVCGIIYGELENNSRGSGTKVISRSCIAVDYDHISNLDLWFTEFCNLWHNYKFIMYTSFSHKMGRDDLGNKIDIGQARIRVIIPLECEVRTNVYEDFVNDIFCFSGSPVLTSSIDKSSYQAKRFMYCHSCPIGNTDGFVYVSPGTKLLDISWYPSVKVDSNINTKYAEMPCEYANFDEAVKAFNSKYTGDSIYKSIKDEEYIDFINKVDISWFIQTRLSHIYVDRFKNRYRYVNSESGSRGAVVYGNVLFSNHSSDPAGNGHTQSVFNLLKIHLCEDTYISALNYVKRLLNYRFYQ